MPQSIDSHPVPKAKKKQDSIPVDAIGKYSENNTLHISVKDKNCGYQDKLIWHERSYGK